MLFIGSPLCSYGKKIKIKIKGKPAYLFITGRVCHMSVKAITFLHMGRLHKPQMWLGPGYFYICSHGDSFTPVKFCGQTIKRDFFFNTQLILSFNMYTVRCCVDDDGVLSTGMGLRSELMYLSKYYPRGVAGNKCTIWVSLWSMGCLCHWILMRWWAIAAVCEWITWMNHCCRRGEHIKENSWGRKRFDH